MAGAADRIEAPWPYGPYYPICLQARFDAGGSDTGAIQDDGAVCAAAYYCSFSFYVKEAWMIIGNWADSSGGVPIMNITDDTSPAQEFVADLALDDSGEGTTNNAVLTQLTVADEGPALKGAMLFLNVDSDTTSVEMSVSVTLLVQPLYSPKPEGTI